MKKITIAIVLAIILGVAYWLLSPFWLSKTVQEALPVEPTTVQTDGGDSSGTARIVAVDDGVYARSKEDSSVTNEVISCPDSEGPPSMDVIVCRIIRDSQTSTSHRPISRSDSDRLLVALKEFSGAMNDLQSSAIDQSEFEQRIEHSNKACVEIAGASCDVLLFEPSSR